MFLLVLLYRGNLTTNVHLTLTPGLGESSMVYLEFVLFDQDGNVTIYNQNVQVRKHNIRIF